MYTYNPISGVLDLTGSASASAASQGEVDTGTNNTKFVTPLTFTNASKWATKQDSLTVSTGLALSGVTLTSNLSTGMAGGQTLIGGTGVGDVLTIKATTAAGTATTASIVFGVGTDGGTTAAQIYNSGNFNIGNASNTNAKILRIGQSTATVDVGNNSTSAAIWFNQTTPDGTNYGIQGTSSGTIVNATGSIDHRMANSTRYLLTSFAHTFAVSASSPIVTQYSFTGSAVNAQTASTETVGVNFNFAQNIQHATGALALNRDGLFQARTHAFVAASTITDAATFAFTGAPIAGTNATITNSHGILVQSNNVAAGTTNSYGITINAMTGGTNNYSAQFIGGLGVFLSDINLVLGTTTGTKIGTATSQKLSLWNATPIVQPTTGVAAATFAANTSAIANDSATFDGYTIGQIVKALRNIGALA